METEMAKRIVVLGLGNILNHDEGAGVYALKELENIAPEEIRARAELVDGGVLGMDLLPYVEGATHLLILDAVDGAAEPGRVVEYQEEEIELFYRGRISWHQLGFQEVLAVAKVRGKFPEQVHLIGVQPKDISTGLGLSAEVKKAVQEMARKGLEVLTRWLEQEAI